ncbi:MAG: twin-arginine translocation signal domain-containing protein [Kiritimatiellae bacterium]|nr:twin-arginine translocation signal domain-containing protein [Kiritimatiellia bacterium]
MGIDRREFLKGSACAGCLGLVGGCALFQDDLHYRFGGNVHRDFHASILDGYNYVKDNFGMEAVREVLGNVARGVQKSMHEKLKAGDASELLEHWRYYMEREGGSECFSLSETSDGGAVFEVKACPARAHLVKRGIGGGEGLCELTRIFNEELARDTPFTIETVVTADGACRQTLKRNVHQA